MTDTRRPDPTSPQLARQPAPPGRSHPASALNDVVHHRARLGILTVLAEVQTATFPYLKSSLGLTDGNLGRHLEVLAGAGLVSIRKGYQDRRPRTWATLTDAGYAALVKEMDALKELLNQFEQSDPFTH